MGAIDFFRGFGLKLSKSLLTTFIMLAIATFAFVSITNQAFLKPVFTDFIAQQLLASDSSPIEGGYDNLLALCQAQRKETISFPLEGLDREVELNCTELRARGEANFTEFFAESITESMFDSVYNSGTCSGYDCLNTAFKAIDPMQRVSAIMNGNFNAYVDSWNKWFIAGAVLCIVLILLLAQGWSSKILGVGIPLAFSGVPYFFIRSLQAQLETNLPARALFAIGEMTSVLSRAFLVMLVVGVAFTLAGFALKFYTKRKEGKSSAKKK